MKWKLILQGFVSFHLLMMIDLTLVFKDLNFVKTERTKPHYVDFTERGFSTSVGERFMGFGDVENWIDKLNKNNFD